MLNSLRHSAIELLDTVDILVVGAGSAGCCAALAARQQGNHRVMLIDRHGCPGGTSSLVLDTFYGFFSPGETPRKVVGGLPDCIVDDLDATGSMFLRPNTYGAGTGVTYNPERLKQVWDEQLAGAAVEVLLHAQLIDTITNPAGHIEGVVVATKGGLFRIEARRFIDASGDADLCHYADVPYEKAGDLDPAQTMTTTFRLSNVDLERYEDAGGNTMLVARMEEAVRNGTHSLPRKEGSVHEMVQRGCVATVAVRVAELDITDPRQFTQAEIEGRRQAFIYERFLRDCVPGYEQAHIIALSGQIGVRETRRVHGNYRLTRDDVLDVSHFDDVVFLCAAPIEDHRVDENGQETDWAYTAGRAAYDVPYRCLVARGRDELWIAGRCFSATHDAHASCRSMAQTMSMGQASGLAAALSLEQDCGAGQVPVRALQDKLFELGAVLETPGTTADTSRDGWKANRRNPAARA